MKKFNVLLPAVLFDGTTETSFWYVNNEKWKFHIIDIVSCDWDANDCRKSLINHDWYSTYILCIEAN